MVRTREELLQSVHDAAYRYEHDFGGCTQSVLRSLQDHFGGIPDDVIKAGHSLAGGGALGCQGTCGSLSGGLMAISSFLGRPKDGFGREREFKASYKTSMKLYDRFLEEYGSPLCPDVQRRIMGRSFDLRIREGNIEFDQAGGHEDKCPSVVGNTARWTADLLLEAGFEPFP
ncbi:MAG: C_GCAxxG_C_C family protein [Candidatus Thermoplasmatota archaeon]|nr:C_GCAxxG_C_C family protein [Candidatus Thermoplasmatota archaeon]